jgi:hypothetical protein
VEELWSDRKNSGLALAPGAKRWPTDAGEFCRVKFRAKIFILDDISVCRIPMLNLSAAGA